MRAFLVANGYSATHVVLDGDDKYIDIDGDPFVVALRRVWMDLAYLMGRNTRQ